MQVGQDLSKYMRPPNLMGPTQSINALQSNSSSSTSSFSSSTTPQPKSFSVLTMEKGGFESYNYSGHGKPLIISSSKYPHHLKLQLHLLFACMYILTSCENFQEYLQGIKLLKTIWVISFVCKICCVDFDLSMYQRERELISNIVF